jgi:hypothetical protein
MFVTVNYNVYKSSIVMYYLYLNVTKRGFNRKCQSIQSSETEPVLLVAFTTLDVTFTNY